MSNLTDFFGATGKPTAAVTGTTLEALTAGDGIKITETGEFVKSVKSAFVNDTVSYDSTVSDNDGVQFRYTSHDQSKPSNFYTSSGVIIGWFWQAIEQNNNNTNGWGFRTYTDDGSYTQNNTMRSTNMYSDYMYYNVGCKFWELENDGTFTYVAALTGWKNSSNSRSYAKLNVLKIQNSTGNIVSTSVGGQLNTTQNTYAMGVGGASINGLDCYLTASGHIALAYSFASGANNESTNNYVQCYTYDKSAPPAALPDSGSANIHSYDGDTGRPIFYFVPLDLSAQTFLLFVWRGNSTISGYKVYQVTVSASGAVSKTTASDNLAFPSIVTASGNTNGNNKSVVVRVADGVYGYITSDNSNYLMQKFTYDGTDFTASGSIITFAGDYDARPHTNLNHDVGCNYHIGMDKFKLYYSNGSTSVENHVVTLNLVNGTLTSADDLTSLSSNSVTPKMSQMYFGKGGGLHIQEESANHEKWAGTLVQGPYFAYEKATKDYVGVAMADAAEGATDASVRLFEAIVSTTSLPSASYVQKGEGFYLLNVENNGLNPVAASAAKLLRMPESSLNHSSCTFNQNNNADWFHQEGYSDRQKSHRPQITCPNYQTTTLLSVSGKGKVDGDISWGHRYNSTSSMSGTFKIFVDGVEVFSKGGTYYGYNYISRLAASSTAHLTFEKKIEFKVVSPSVQQTWQMATNIVSYT